MVWDLCAWVGIATLSWLFLRVAHDTVEGFIVVRIGWTRLEELGFWRAILVAVRRRPFRP